MIVPIKDQKVRPRNDRGVTPKYTSRLSFSLPRAGQVFSLKHWPAVVAETLVGWTTALAALARRAPFEFLPVYLAVPLFIILLSTLSPVIAPSRDFRIPVLGLDFPADNRLDLLLLNSTNVEEAFKEAEKIESAAPTPNAPTVKVLQVQKYVVKPGDSLSSVANQFSVSLSTLINYNSIDNVRRIQGGMELQVPNMDGILYTVKRGDSLSAISKKYNVDYDTVLDANKMETPVISVGMKVFLPGASLSNWELKQALGELFIYPTRGQLTSTYGYRDDPFTGVRRFHNGIDLANAPGTAIRAAMDGRVTDVGFHSSYGNYIVLNHDRGYQTLYGHLRAFSVKRGDYVTQGQLIGQMGNTGYSTGTHLHFCIFRYNQHLDPLKILN